ncbi:MAG: hypothetical protein EXR72_24380 [Myxococcales bacterium]|nr:hypothetical protein [Myxococcales bacterium]
MALLLVIGGCGDTGQRLVDYPAFGQGSREPTMAGEWIVTLDVANVGIGPIYFCATEAASSDLCPTAVNELAAVAAIDALESGPLGRVTGVTGAIRSATYDFAITWFNRQKAPQAAPEAPGGHSAQFEGRATRGARTVRFVADIDVLPPHAGSLAVQGVRVSGLVSARTARLEVTLDPHAFFGAVDFDELALAVEDPVVVRPGSRAYSAIVLRMSTTAAPTFTFSNGQL